MSVSPPQPAVITPPPLLLPVFPTRVSTGFPSPAADYTETRIDLNLEIIKNPAFTYFAWNEGDSMYPSIRDGSLLIIDRKVDQPDGCVVMLSINAEFCVRRLFKFKDGSIELRSDNKKYKPINLSDEFEGQFEIFGRVIWTACKL